MLLSTTLCGVVVLTGCSQKQAPRSNPAVPPAALPPSVPDKHAESAKDWGAVVTALNGAGKNAHGVALAASGYTGNAYRFATGYASDMMKKRKVQALEGGPSRCGYAWPSTGTISRGFKPGHKGVDIFGPVGTPIHASRAGEVIYSGDGFSGFGNVVIIQHDPCFTTFYAHNDRNLVKPSQRVKLGEQIATIGETGRASGPHLHFEIRDNGKAIDPGPFLN